MAGGSGFHAVSTVHLVNARQMGEGVASSLGTACASAAVPGSCPTDGSMPVLMNISTPLPTEDSTARIDGQAGVHGLLVYNGTQQSQAWHTTPSMLPGRHPILEFPPPYPSCPCPLGKTPDTQKFISKKKKKVIYKSLSGPVLGKFPVS